MTLSHFKVRKEGYRKPRGPKTFSNLTELGHIPSSRGGYVASKVEATCMLRYCLANLSRVEDGVSLFYRAETSDNEIFYETLQIFTAWASPPVSVWDPNEFFTSRFRIYAKAIEKNVKTSNLNVVGFIDGTQLEIVRPGADLQMANCSGHKQKHCLSWQAVTMPYGLFAHIFGPHEG
jgi:hypothetical protein